MKGNPFLVLISVILCQTVIVGAPLSANDKDDDAKTGRTQFEQEQRKRLAKVEPEFGKIYFLNENEVLRHIPEPLNEDLRNQWMRAVFGTPPGANRLETTVLFLKWQDGRAQWNGASMGGPVRTGVEFRTVLAMLKIGSTQSVDGEEALLKHSISGDWIVDPRAPVEKLVTALEPILRKQWEIPVTLRFRDDERDVYVVSGEWEFEAISKEYSEVQIYGKHLDKNSGAGGGTGAFAEFLDHVGSWIKLPIINEVAKPPTKEVSWRFHIKSPFTALDYSTAHDPETVTENLEEQTGLTFTRERRKVRILFVEQGE